MKILARAIFEMFELNKVLNVKNAEVQTTTGKGTNGSLNVKSVDFVQLYEAEPSWRIPDFPLELIF